MEQIQASWQINYDPQWALFTEFKDRVAPASERLVIGQRGPYVELLEIEAELVIPENEGWRLDNEQAYYVHYRLAGRAPIKVYLQKRPVSYADYRVDRYYISPFDLFRGNGRPLCLFQRAGRQPSLFADQNSSQPE